MEMSDAILGDLRKEHSELSSRATRMAISSLVLLAVTSLTFTRALRSMHAGEIRDAIRHVRGLEDRTQQKPDLPWIADFVTGVTEKLPPAEGLEKQTALEKWIRDTVDSAFTVEESFAGSRFRFNLLYWAGVLPFVAFASLAYLAITISKMEAIRRIAASRIQKDKDASPVDRLTFGTDALPTYATYPGRLGAIAYVVGMTALAVDLGMAIVGSLDSESIFLLIELSRYLLLFAFYTYAITASVRRRIFAEADAITGVVPKVRTQGRLRRLAERVHALSRRRWRVFSSAGSGLTLLTLVLTTAGTKSCAEPRTGLDLVRNQRDAVWPVMAGSSNGAWFVILPLGRFVYIASIIFAGLLILLMTLTLLPSAARLLGRQVWLWDGVRSVSVVLFFFVVCEMGFVFSLAIGLSLFLPPAWELVYWLVPSFLYLWMNVLRKRRRGEQWRRRVRPAVWMLYAPAVVVGPAAMTCFMMFEMRGVPVYVLGVTLMAAGLVSAPAAVTAAAAEPDVGIVIGTHHLRA